MAEKVEVQPESLLNLDDLLQCPVCYEIPTGQIFQCNEGHHVCGRCKIRLDVCPVCRALFFGTRNYAMEELIANFRKLRAFKLSSKATTGSGSSESSTPARDVGSAENENDTGEDEENNPNVPDQIILRAPQACKGLFRCLCCKNGNGERLPSARLLNHLRYFHSPDLIEGLSENGEYLQAWQFSTAPGRLVTAVRVADMGVFFLIIEIKSESLCAWLTMAASPWIAHEFCYTVTISGNDREAIFSDCVSSVRSCEGALKKRGHCLIVSGSDATALTSPPTISGKLSLRRTPTDQLAHQTQPRAVMRVANRVNYRDNVMQDLQDNFERLSRTVANLEANSMDLRTIIQAEYPTENGVNGDAHSEVHSEAYSDDQPVIAEDVIEFRPTNEHFENGVPMSRNARRRMRQRLRTAFEATQPPVGPVPPMQEFPPLPTLPDYYMTNFRNETPSPTLIPQAQSTNGPSTSNGNIQNGNQGRNNKKKRRHQRR